MSILDLVFPRRCLGCHKIGAYFCAPCRLGIHPISKNEKICPMCGRLALDGITHPRCRATYGIDGLTSFFHYDGIIRKAVKAIKYRNISDLAEEFMSLIPDVYLPSGSIIPIPLHIARYRMRGYNQAEVLGKYFAVKYSLPLYSDILFRTKKAPPQVEMKHRSERMENMKNVFSLSPHHSYTRNPFILLFDDVFTTGATMRSAASVLKRGGVKSVWAVTMAR